jgi:N-methylhydantoinase A
VEQPARTVLSGPAAGVLGAVSVAVQTGFKDIVSLDMGGTSADISVVKNSRLLTTTDGKLLSYPFRFPMVDVSAIGAGGGSIAWVDSVGSLHVGPESAGADPGPCCYGRGGTEPTVTDASVVLGYLNPSYFAAGTLSLDVNAAHRAVERIGEPLGLSVPEAAWAIHAIVNAKMADEIRLWTVCRGYDPRDFALVLLGGAGPVNGGMLAKSLSISTLLVPITPGVLSAFGLLVANIEHDNSASFKMSEDQVTAEVLRQVYEDLDRRGLESMEKDRVPAEEVRVTRSADMRYLGQSYELNVLLEEEVGGETAGRLVRDFHSKHHQVYGQSSTEAPVEFVNLRTVHWYPLQKPEVPRPKGGGGWADAQKESRRAYFFPDHAEGVEVPVYDRARLPVDLEQKGPLVIEQRDTTTVVYPDQSCRMDRAGNIILKNTLERR